MKVGGSALKEERCGVMKEEEGERVKMEEERLSLVKVLFVTERRVKEGEKLMGGMLVANVMEKILMSVS